MQTVEDYLAQVQLDKIQYINHIPLDKVVPTEEIPQLNPLTMKYSRYWLGELEKCLDGFWVSHKGMYKYVPGMMYFYGRHWHIELSKKGTKSKAKEVGNPQIRDVEWIKFYLFMEARGFSGFADDDEYTCNIQVNATGDDLREDLITPNCYNKKGEFKKYMPAREYLWRYTDRALGLPLFENLAYNVVDLESRGIGKSFLAACLLGGTFTFDGAQSFKEHQEKSLTVQTLIGASDSAYSDDTVSKIKLGLKEFRGEYKIGEKLYPPPFFRPTSGSWDAGNDPILQEAKLKVGNNWVYRGSKSKIHHRSFHNNHKAANGTRPAFMVVDEIGFMGNLLEAYGQILECVADGADQFGTVWFTGTGGDMDGGNTQAVMAVFYDPEAYNCVAIEDYYENSGNKIGFFVPAWMGLNQFKDDLGNTNVYEALRYLFNARAKKRKAKTSDAINAELSQRPIIPSEVFLIAGVNLFPTAELKTVYDKLRTTNDVQDQGTLGWMQFNGESAEFVPDVDGNLQENSWPVRPSDEHKGAVVIYKPPEKDIPYGLTLGGIDPYDHDTAGSSVSLGSILIMQRAGMHGGRDEVVAEYTGRPESAAEFYEQCRLLMMYYNTVGSTLYENEKMGIKTYLENNNSLHLLAPTPGILKSNIKTTVDRGLGQHMSTPVKRELTILLRDWLIAPAGNGKKNLHFIKSKGLLLELINYNEKGNFDRVIALMLCVLQLTQMHKILISKETKNEMQEDPFFARHRIKQRSRTFKDVKTYADHYKDLIN